MTIEILQMVPADGYYAMYNTKDRDGNLSMYSLRVRYLAVVKVDGQTQTELTGVVFRGGKFIPCVADPGFSGLGYDPNLTKHMP